MNNPDLMPMSEWLKHGQLQYYEYCFTKYIRAIEKCSNIEEVKICTETVKRLWPEGFWETKDAKSRTVTNAPQGLGKF